MQEMAARAQEAEEKKKEVNMAEQIYEDMQHAYDAMDAKDVIIISVVATVAVTVDATREVMTAEVQDPQIHAMVAAGEGLPEAIADRADQDSEAQVVAASVVTDRAEAAADVESASPQHSSRLLVSGSYGAKRGDALDRRA